MEDQDPEEKHFIGDLLSDLATEWHEQDDDVFRAPGTDASGRGSTSASVMRGTERQKTHIQQPNPIGIPAGSTFAQWPEPPPPYSPPTSNHGWYTGKPGFSVIAVDTSVPPPSAAMIDGKQAVAFMHQAGIRLPPGVTPGAPTVSSSYYNPFGAGNAHARHATSMADLAALQGNIHHMTNMHPHVGHQSSDAHLLQQLAAYHHSDGNAAHSHNPHLQAAISQHLQSGAASQQQAVAAAAYLQHKQQQQMAAMDAQAVAHALHAHNIQQPMAYPYDMAAASGNATPMQPQPQYQQQSQHQQQQSPPQQQHQKHHHQQQQTGATPASVAPVSLPKTGVSYSAAASQHKQQQQAQQQHRNARAQSTSSVPHQSRDLSSTNQHQAMATQLNNEQDHQKSRNGSSHSSAKDTKEARSHRYSANSTPPLQHLPPSLSSSHSQSGSLLSSSQSTTNEFQKITGRKGKTGKQQQQSSKSVGRKYSAAEVVTTSDNMAPVDKQKTRFQILSSEADQRAGRQPVVAKKRGSESPDSRDEADDDDDDSGSINSEYNPSGQQAGGKSGRSDTLRHRTGKSASKNANGGRGVGGRKGRRGHEQTPLQLVLGYVYVLLQSVFAWLTMALTWLRDLLVEVFVAIVDITAHGVRHMWCGVCDRSERIYHYCSERLYAFALTIRHPRLWLDKLMFSRSSWRFWARQSDQDADSWGLDETIQLPTTGDEAMRRLLMCKGQDAYSILGLRSDCSDEEIKRYYKRQAVLVHPDKNMSYGADEAFKILAAAFDMIGKPERREQYNMANIHRTKEMKQFEQLMQQLRAKMDEALSTMQCDCGNKHHRYNTKRDPLLCRFCRRCNDMHSAKDNDIWAESRWFGFLWYYFACIDGAVYDITEWASCPKNLLKHMKANDHLIKYRLISTKQSSGQSQRHDLPSEAEVDAWLQRVQRSAAQAQAAGNPSASAASLLLDSLNFPGSSGNVPPNTSTLNHRNSGGDSGNLGNSSSFTRQQQQQQQSHAPEQRQRFSEPFGQHPSSSNDSMSTATASYRPPERGSTRKAGRRRKAK